MRNKLSCHNRTLHMYFLRGTELIQPQINPFPRKKRMVVGLPKHFYAGAEIQCYDSHSRARYDLRQIIYVVVNLFVFLSVWLLFLPALLFQFCVPRTSSIRLPTKTLLVLCMQLTTTTGSPMFSHGAGTN